MTNGEKYKTAQERAEAFLRYCDCKICDNCELDDKRISMSILNDNVCLAFWLDLEAEDEKPFECPFCGCYVYLTCANEMFYCACKCGYSSTKHKTSVDAIAAHNRVAKKCMEVNE